MRVQVEPWSVDRKMPRTPPIFALVYRVWYEAPVAALPKPMASACSTLDSLVKDVPPFVECHRPYAPSVAPPASHTSPLVPDTALKRTLSPLGSPVAAEAVKVAPPSVLT